LISLNAARALLAKLPLSRGLVPVSACALGAWLALGSWDFIQQLPAQPALDASPPAAAQPLPALDPAPIASLFGATPPETQANTYSVPLTLLASLAAQRSEDSRALIGAPDSTAFYSIGDRLPGGASLSAISPDHVMVLQGGRLQTLAFSSHPERLLLPTTEADSSPLAETQP